MPGQQHRDMDPDHNGGKGSHGIRSWSNVLDEAARALKGATAGLGICVYQTAGTMPGFYVSRGPGLGWVFIGGFVGNDAPRTMTASGAVLATDTIIFVDSALGAVTLDLPAAATAVSARIDIVHTVPTNLLTFDPDGSELIQGNATTTLAGDGVIRSITIAPNAGAWFII